MAKARQVDWLLVGAGDISEKRVAPALAVAGSSRIVGVCDRLPERTRALAEAFGIKESYTDLDEALVRTAANAVYIATPVYLHVPLAIAALEAGKHVLVEKPLGLNAAEAARAVAVAASKGLQAGCAYFRRCSPRYAQAKKMLESGQFGQVVLVSMTYFSWFKPAEDDPKYWRVVKSQSGGGPLADMGSHMFDVMIGLLGMPRKVYARVSNKVHPYEAEDSAVLLMELADGADVVASFNWNSKTWAHEFEIVGTEAKVKWFPYDSGKVVKTVGRDIEELDLPNEENVHLPLVEDFCRAVLSGSEPIVPFAEAAKTNIVLDAVYRSAESGAEVLL